MIFGPDFSKQGNFEFSNNMKFYDEIQNFGTGVCREDMLNWIKKIELSVFKTQREDRFGYILSFAKCRYFIQR